MDYKTFRKKIADETGRTMSDVDSLVDGLAMIIRESAENLDTVAIPTFGAFVPVKRNEEVSTDLSSGRRLLLPPEIRLEFTPGSMLVKHLNNE